MKIEETSNKKMNNKKKTERKNRSPETRCGFSPFFPFEKYNFFLRHTVVLLAKTNLFFQEKQICVSCGSTNFFLFQETQLRFSRKQICASRRSTLFSRKHNCSSCGSKIVLRREANMCASRRNNLCFSCKHIFFFLFREAQWCFPKKVKNKGKQAKTESQ